MGQFRSFLLLFCFAITACQPSKKEEENSADLIPEEFALPESAWIDKRVVDAKLRLNETAAGQLLWNSISAHGGLDRWYGMGPLSFRFNYQPVGNGKPKDTYQIVDTWSSRVIHQLPEQPDVEFGWDGEKNWIKPANTELDFDGGFWALTPYYFVAVPFVLADEGVILEELSKAGYRGMEYRILKASFKAGVGQSPNDYYLLYIHPETFQVDAIRYIVSHPSYYPKGGHSSEKFMTYENKVSVEGMLFSQLHNSHLMKGDSTGELVTITEVSRIQFRPEIKKSVFEMPEGAGLLH